MFGQHAALSTGDTKILNPTTAAPGRVRGTGEITGEVTINEIVQGGDSDNNTTASEGQNNRVMATMFPPPLSPNRRTGPNDGRRGTNRGRNFNIHLT